MPTGASSDVIPVSKATKERLARVKGDETYNGLLDALLRIVPPEELARRVRAAREAEARRLERARAPPEATTREPQRTPEKQRLLARLAEESWRDWLARGQVARLGPRRYRWSFEPAPRGAEEVRVERRPGRGLAP